MPDQKFHRENIVFGPFEANLETEELKKNGARLALAGQSFRILVILLENSGRLVPREELQKALWPADTFVDFEKGLNAAVNRLRESLGDSAEKPRYIETLPRRGYRFVAVVSVAQGAEKQATSATFEVQAKAPSAVPRSRWIFLAAVGTCVAVALSWAAFRRQGPSQAGRGPGTAPVAGSPKRGSTRSARRSTDSAHLT